MEAGKWVEEQIVDGNGSGILRIFQCFILPKDMGSLRLEERGWWQRFELLGQYTRHRGCAAELS